MVYHVVKLQQPICAMWITRHYHTVLDYIRGFGTQSQPPWHGIRWQRSRFNNAIDIPVKSTHFKDHFALLESRQISEIVSFDEWAMWMWICILDDSNVNWILGRFNNNEHWDTHVELDPRHQQCVEWWMQAIFLHTMMNKGRILSTMGFMHLGKGGWSIWIKVQGTGRCLSYPWATLKWKATIEQLPGIHFSRWHH